MSGLNTTISEIYRLLKKQNINVYAEYEKIPVAKHEDIYVVCSVPVITLKNRMFSGTVKYYDAKYSFCIRLLAAPDTDPSTLYTMLDDSILCTIAEGGMEINGVEICAPYQDHGLKRLVLECRVEISGKSEVSYGT